MPPAKTSLRAVVRCALDGEECERAMHGWLDTLVESVCAAMCDAEVLQQSQLAKNFPNAAAGPR